VPVVCSPFGALPETVGDAALLVDPGRPGELSDALLAVLEDAALRERLIAAGLERAARYSWQRVARETDGALGELLGSR
jgi:alpha-1,3-rhamnosyl/mannosyltransferase